MQYLRDLVTNTSNNHNNSNNQARRNEEEDQIITTIADRKRWDKWTITHSTERRFTNEPALKRIQLSNSNTMTLERNKVSNKKTSSNKSGRKNCMSCGKDKVVRNVRKHCELCGGTISLCKKY